MFNFIIHLIIFYCIYFYDLFKISYFCDAVLFLFNLLYLYSIMFYSIPSIMSLIKLK